MSIRSIVALSFGLGGLVTIIFVWLGLQYMLVNQTEANLILIITLTAHLIGAIVSYLLLSPTVRDLQRLTLQVKRVSTHNFAPISKVNAPKELKSLADNFNYMLQTLEQSFVSLSQSEEEKRHLIAQLGHDIKTPLASLKTQVEALHDGMIHDEELERFYQLMENQVDRLTTLTNQLMEVALVEQDNLSEKPVPTQYKELKLDQLLVAVLTPFQIKCQRKQQELTVSIPNTLPSVFSDELKLHRILSNLLDNASKYSPDKSSIRLVVEASDSHVFFHIEDSGIGIPEEELPLIFQRLYRVDKSRNSQTGGSGLGLYISQSLAQQLGGNICVRSTFGSGSTFTLQIPQTRSSLS